MNITQNMKSTNEALHIQREQVVSLRNKLLVLLGFHLFFALMYIIRQLSLIESYSAIPDTHHPNRSINDLVIHIVIGEFFF